MDIETVFELTPENFQDILMKAQGTTLVVVVFWMQGKDESEQYKNTLVNLTEHYQGNLIVATVECTAQQAIAMQFGVRTVPTTVLVKDHRPINSLEGVQDEQTIQQALEPHLPSIDELLLAQAVAAINEQNYQQAYEPAKKAYELNSTRGEVIFTYSQVLVALGQIELAEELLRGLGLVDQNQDYHNLLAQIELAKNAANSPELLALEEQVKIEPSNLDLSVQLAVKYDEVNRTVDALNTLLTVLRKDLNFGEAKPFYLAILAKLPAGDVLIQRYRSKLYSLLY